MIGMLKNAAEVCSSPALSSNDVQTCSRPKPRVLNLLPTWKLSLATMQIFTANRQIKHVAMANKSRMQPVRTHKAVGSNRSILIP
jgi:hypothetical protein